MAKFTRTMNIQAIASPYDTDVVSFNYQSGAHKTLPTGPHLLPIPTSSGWTTNTTAATGLPALGMNIAIYNNSGTAGSVTIGNTPALTSQAIGAVDANGNVGVACPPNAWTYLSTGLNQWVITSASTMITYIYDDNTFILQQSSS